MKLFLFVFAIMLTACTQPNSILDTGKIAARLSAKEMCSCLFVENQSVEFCKKRTDKKIPLFQVKIDEKNRTVRAGYFKLVEARFVSERLGCRHVP